MSSAEAHDSELIRAELPPEMAARPAFVQQLTLSYFRNYTSLRMDLDARPVVLVGANGAGKTNILEAVSLLTPGRGLRHAAMSELDAQDGTGGVQPWAVASVLHTPDGEVRLGTGRDPNTPQRESRIALLDGKRVRGMGRLGEVLSALWLTPQQDQVLFEGSAPRRRFLDRMVYGFDPAHATRVSAYEQAMSERNRLLKQGRAEPAWMDALEQTLATHATHIAAARLAALAQIAAAMTEGPEAFPRARMAVHGLAEDALQSGMDEAAVEAELRTALAAGRAKDALIGRTGVGTHRSQWQVWHPNGREAAQCSTGEQKAVLLAVILAQARACQHVQQRVPLLLLDEVVAHLDITRRAALFEQIQHLRVQAWLTGTDFSLFEGLSPHARTFRVDGAMVEAV